MLGGVTVGLSVDGGYVVVSGGVSRNMQVCFSSYHIGDILYYV